MNQEDDGQEDQGEHRVGEDHVQVDLRVLVDEQANDERDDELTLGGKEINRLVGIQVESFQLIR